MLSSNGLGAGVKRVARNACVVALATAAIGVLGGTLEPALWLEDTAGLPALYAMRGQETPSANVVVVSLDRDSAEALGLTEALDADRGVKGWPRSLHGDLIDALDAAGVAQIAFDLYFGSEQTPEDDAAFAQAMRRSGKVILLEAMDANVDSPPVDEPGSRIGGIGHTRLLPERSLAEAARATAPFVLPKRPDKVNKYWPFLEHAFDEPSLPVVAFAVYANEAQALVVDELTSLRPELGPALHEAGLTRQMSAIRRALRGDDAVARALRKALTAGAADDAVVGRARTLVDLYTAKDEQLYLRLYGTPRTITTVPIHEILRGEIDPDIRWQGATVFVGYSDRTQPDQDDEFLSVYSQADGLDVSGVEFAATAFANLVESQPLKPLALGTHRALLAILGLVFGAGFLLRSGRAAIGTLLVSLGAYLLSARFAFTDAGSWWPVAMPAIQASAALVLGLGLRYFTAEKSRAAVSHGASLYLPAELVDRFAENPEAAARSSELVSGTCMVTDIEGFTAFSESLPPTLLETTLNTYYDALFEIIRQNGGLVTDIVGDSMVAVWRDAPSAAPASSGPIQAALDIGAHLTESMPTFPRTRVGITAGEFLLGAVGARAHLEYRAVGDTVNSASRVQVLNKQLGTTVLSARTALPEQSVHYRELGTFQLSGKRNLLEICEPLSTERLPDTRQLELSERFAAALDAFRCGDWQQAVGSFEAILDELGDDGPTRFYIDHIRTLQQQSPLRSADTVIRFAD